MKIALVHDLLVKLWGGEKVLECLMNMYPEADIFPLLYDEKKVGNVFPREKIKFLPGVPKCIYKIFKNQRFTLPFLPKAVESIDLSEYDIVIVSNTAFAHGVLTKPNTKTIIYYHSPVRYLWDRTFEYRREIGWGKGIRARILGKIFTKLRMWDYIASQRHDITLANSHNVAKRLKKYYGLDAQVIYPNVDTQRFQKKVSVTMKLPTQKYYIIISALTEFKKVHIWVEAFSKMPEQNLVIVGTGNYENTLQKKSGENIYFLWYQAGDELVYLLQNSQGLIFCGEEDFGIVPIEAFGAGKPVFAYKWGWLAETMQEWVSGAFFEDADWADFIEKFQAFDRDVQSGKYQSKNIQKIAERYDTKIFEEEIRKIVGI